MAKRVIVYHQPRCSACDAAMRYLEEKGIPYTHKDVTTDLEAQREMTALGSQSTPTVVVDGNVLIGFSPSKLRALL